MKKSLLLTALMMGAMTMTAQITKVGTIAGRCEVYSNDDCIGNVVYSTEQDSTKTKITFFDNNFSVYKTLSINKESKNNQVCIEQVSKNFFSLDEKIGFLYQETIQQYPNYSTAKLKIMDEDGNIIYNFTDDIFFEGSQIHEIEGTYYLFLANIDVQKHDISDTYIYSLPGRGLPAGTEDTTAPVRQSNVRKVIENGQMYIILDGVKYEVTGSTTL